MRNGDVLSLPVNPAMPRVFWRWADAKVLAIHHDAIVEFEFIAGEKDGMLLAIDLGELDRMLEREGGEDWKTHP